MAQKWRGGFLRLNAGLILLKQFAIVELRKKRAETVIERRPALSKTACKEAEMAKRVLSEHRRVWLEVHPERDEAWLRRMGKEGFDVHHIDGDHRNNDPANLVLVEHRDHFMLHSGKRPKLHRVQQGATRGAKRRDEVGEAAYVLRCGQRLTWGGVGHSLKVGDAYASACAKHHALKNGLEWPVKVTDARFWPDTPAAEAVREWVRPVHVKGWPNI